MDHESLEAIPIVGIFISTKDTLIMVWLYRAETYIYVMLDLNDGCRVSGYQRNSHITVAQLMDANTGQA